MTATAVVSYYNTIPIQTNDELFYESAGGQFVQRCCQRWLSQPKSCSSSSSCVSERLRPLSFSKQWTRHSDSNMYGLMTCIL